MQDQSVTVILSGYKRPHTLGVQYNAVVSQTVRPTDILFYQNESEYSNNFDPEILRHIKHTRSNFNTGVWGRFAHALNCKTKYICIFDDDTIPGERFLENCINSFNEKPGLYGTIGLVFNNDTYYSPERYGWDVNNNDEITQVDIVGHCWFFSREMLSAFWRELPDENDFYVGEDMHFSHMLQKYTDYKTYVPPHPIGDKSLWGSIHALQLGCDNVATANFAVPMMDEYYRKIVDRGFKIIKS